MFFLIPGVFVVPDARPGLFLLSLFMNLHDKAQIEEASKSAFSLKTVWHFNFDPVSKALAFVVMSLPSFLH